jgi:GntR family transcriptional regulator/MocR family aminotransferase
MLIPLKLVRDQQLQQQLFDQLRALIVSRRLRPGTRLPSSRMMAEQFAISRVTVLLTYERLIADGYLETRPAAGTFVARPPGPVRPCISAVAEPAEHPGHAMPEPEPRAGCPDPSLFPAGRWRSLLRAGLDSLGEQRATGHPAGSAALRDAIASWVSASRGLAVAPDQVLVVRSRQQALHLAAGLAWRAWPSGARIVLEDPCDAATAATLVWGRGEPVQVPVDADGLCTDRLPAGNAALLHVTPEHQRPFGAALSLDRRLALLDWAARSGALVLEEDCEGELRYGDMNAPSLMSLDEMECVVRIGGFGVSLGPWVDVAYLVVPRRLIAAAIVARRLIDDSRGGLEHAALTKFLEGGGYARHLHRLTRTYAGRRDVLIAALRRQFGQNTRVLGEQAGLHLAWYPPADGGSPDAIATLARHSGLDAAALADGVVLIGFGVPDENHIETGVRRLAAAMTEADDGLPRISALSAGFARSG